MPSTAIRHFHYDTAEHRLDVQFVSGKRYSYFDVPENLAAEMTKATSKGGFFNHHIRDRFPFTRR
ncbi:KTSC domain-containing protein [Sphingobium sp. Cam5-1]|uniref:KTSC domain-containing protein n=1 Tax=Sphingobium sp. Cam5-1 TaxID=2789327 RepID=UPI0018AD1474|nr:KTSC domain-containing protein [Sphingobium sp. Cam5-1]QPI71778.1 KTSC domain-containing protein [Sphingobium sp. Cam5-1]